MLAVRKVSELIKRKKAAGNEVQELKMTEKWELAQTLCLNNQSQSFRTILKNKRNRRKKSLDIATMTDRAQQMLIKMALEPEWEAKFDENSYGFRPGRSCHDAMSAVSQSLDKVNQFCLNAYIQGCFENIDQNKFLNKVDTFPTMRRQLKSCLKTGLIQGNLFINQKNSSPDKGILSPLLANIALNGMDNFIKDNIAEEFFNQKTVIKTKTSYQKCRGIICIVRYGDNFVILNKDRNILSRAKELVREWLAKIGLQLDEGKTKIVDSYQGFDFLGWNFKTSPIGRHQFKKGFSNSKLLIKPSKKSIAKHYQEIKSIFRQSTHLNINQLIKKLNIKMKGWAKYNQFVMSSKAFRRLDNLVYKLQWQWAKRKHPDKGIKELKEMYFTSIKSMWKLSYPASEQTEILFAYRNQATSRYVSVKRSKKSIYDRDWAYWETRVRSIVNNCFQEHQYSGNITISHIRSRMSMKVSCTVL